MKSKVILFAAAAAAMAAGLYGQAAFAATPIDVSMTAQFYGVAATGGKHNDSPDPDFPTVSSNPSQPDPHVAVGSRLGRDGAPVVSSNTGPSRVSDVTRSGELEWWSPSLDSNVKYLGSTTVELPYSSNMFATTTTSHGKTSLATGRGVTLNAGKNNDFFFETAVFTGSFTTAANTLVDFSVTSDDDSFIYVDGALLGSLAGIHADETANFTDLLGSGSHELQIFYADREQTQAFLSVGLEDISPVVTPPTAGVPEPGAWSLMLLGIGALGLALRASRHRRDAASLVA